MPKVRVVNPVNIPWMVEDKDGADQRDPVDWVRLAESHDDSAPVQVRLLHPGDDDDLQVLDVRMEPGHEVKSHAHLHNEVIYVLDGSLKFGRRVLKPGYSVFVPAMTLYKFRAGDEGLRFINVRPKRDDSHFTKEQLVEHRRAARKSPA